MCAGIATLVLSRKIVYGCIGMCIGCSVNHIELNDNRAVRHRKGQQFGGFRGAVFRPACASESVRLAGER
jgi:hypothetical protein